MLNLFSYFSSSLFFFFFFFFCTGRVVVNQQTRELISAETRDANATAKSWDAYANTQLARK